MLLQYYAVVRFDLYDHNARYRSYAMKLLSVLRFDLRGVSTSRTEVLD